MLDRLTTCYDNAVMTFENKLKTSALWLQLGSINHLIALFAIAIGCVYSGFTCQGEAMKNVLSTYAFTLFTPQLALEAILLIAIFLVCNSLRELRDNWRSLLLFCSTLLALVLFAYSQ